VADVLNTRTEDILRGIGNAGGIHLVGFTAIGHDRIAEQG
jgi:hypothetical protein